MTTKKGHIVKTLSSTIYINGRAESIWENITNVKIEQFSDPTIFKLLDIPKPLKAEIISEGQGGRRIAYFDSGKKFMQEILVWKPLTEYSFSFNPEKGFKVLYFFELSAHLNFWTQVVFVSLSFGWMIFFSTLVRKVVIKKDKERIALLIEKFERISAQFKEQQ